MPTITEHHCLDFCQQNTQLSKLIQSAKLQLQCAHILNTLLPNNLSTQCQVVKINDDGVLLILAKTGTIAKKLQWLSLSWQSEFMRHGLPVKTIKVSVLPSVTSVAKPQLNAKK
ncbi:MAG: DUF721 domain-containing protein [Neisseriales bacterium]|nr:MAG: DUF721 domain-containing protein [Neisseriales bacterium]